MAATLAAASAVMARTVVRATPFSANRRSATSRMFSLMSVVGALFGAGLSLCSVTGWLFIATPPGAVSNPSADTLSLACHAGKRLPHLCRAGVAQDRRARGEQREARKHGHRDGQGERRV